MRHFVSLVIGLVTAPLVWLLVGFGQLHLINLLARFAQTDPLRLAGPLALLVAAGVVYGLVATTRISPLGPIICGLLLVAGQALWMLFPRMLAGVLSFDVFGTPAGHVVIQPVYTGMVLVLGVGLLMATFSFSRWRTPAKDGPPPHLYRFGGPIPGAPALAGAQQPFGSADEAPTTAFPPPGAPGSPVSPSSPASGVVSGPGAAGGPPAGWPDPQLAQRPAAGGQPDHDSERTARLPRRDDPAPPTHPGP